MCVHGRFAMYAFIGCLLSHVAADALQESLPHTPKQDGPMENVQIQCKVFNWQRMACYWESQQNANYTMDYRLGNQLGRYYNCPNLVIASRVCKWDNKEFKFYITGVRLVTHTATEERRSTVVFNDTYGLKHFVEPDPVKNLNAVASAHSAELRWKAPNDDQLPFETSILYRGSYGVSSFQGKDFVIVANTSTIKLTLTDLAAFTNYTVNISCIPLIRNSTSGFLSGNTSTTFQTLEDVPSIAPFVTPGGFYEDPSQTVVLYWQNPSDLNKNGNIKSTRVKYRVRNFDDNWDSNVTNCSPVCYSTTLRLDPEKEYEMTVDCSTSVGFNESLQQSLTRIVIGNARDRHVLQNEHNIRVFSNHSHVEMRWSRVESASGYTVYWCKGESKKCREQLRWINVPAHLDTTAIPLNQASYSDTLFGWSVEREISRSVVSSGITWSKCTYDVGKELRNPTDFRFTSPQEANSLSVAWSSLGCGYYVTKYIIRYWSSEHRNISTDGFNQKEQLLNIPASKLSYDVIIPNLTAGVEYHVQLKSWSPFSESQYSASIVEVVSHQPVPAATSEGKIIWIAVTIFIVMVLVVIIFLCCRKFAKVCCKRIDIKPPDTGQHSLDSNGSSFRSHNSYDDEEEASGLLYNNRPSAAIRPNSVQLARAANDTSRRDNFFGPSGSSAVSDMSSYTGCAMTPMTVMTPLAGGPAITFAGICSTEPDSVSLITNV